MSLTAEQVKNLRVGQTVVTKTFRRAGKITRITTVADGERVVEVDIPGSPTLDAASGNWDASTGRMFKTWVGISQIDSLVTA